MFTRDLELPRGRERKPVWARDRDVTLRSSEVRTLATVGAFRVVPAGDLRDGGHFDLYLTTVGIARVVPSARHGIQCQAQRRGRDDFTD